MLDALYEDKHFPGTEHIEAWGCRGEPNIPDFRGRTVMEKTEMRRPHVPVEGAKVTEQ